MTDLAWIVGLGLICCLVFAGAWLVYGRRRISKEVTNAKDCVELELELYSHVVSFIGASAVALGVLMTARQILDARRASQDQLDAERQRLVVERMSNAMELLDTEKGIPENVAGVYALETVATGDTRLAPAVYQSLLALIRDRSVGASKGQVCTPVDGCDVPPNWCVPPKPCSSHPTDAVQQSALNVLTHLRGSTVVPFDLSGVSLSRANLAGATLSGANYSRSDLSGARLRDTDLTGADLYNTNLYEADLVGVNATGANIVGAYLGRARLGPSPSGSGRRSILDRANLRASVLHSAWLCDASLQGGQLEKAHLGGVIAYKADLRGADVSCASFRNASLAGADLRGVTFEEGRPPDFTGADLGQSAGREYCGMPGKPIGPANVDQRLLDKAVLCRTTMPDGQIVDRDCGGTGANCKW